MGMISMCGQTCDTTHTVRCKLRRTLFEPVDPITCRLRDSNPSKTTALSRQAETYRHSAQRPTTAPSQKQHEARLVELDTKKYGLAKTIADLEQAIASAETALGRSRDEAARTEREDPAAGFEGTIGTA